MIANGTQSGGRAAVCALAFVILFASTIGVAAAAGTTDIGVAVERDALTSGETTTVEVVVEDADGGVGALNATVTLSNPDAVSVAGVTLHGDPALKRVTERDDGVKLSAALADTDDVGSVTVATVVLRAEEPGRTSVDVNVRALGDEDGAAYSLGNVDRPTVTVNDVSGSPSDVRTASGLTDDEATDGSGDRETGNNDDRTSGEDRIGSAGPSPTGQVAETVRMVFSPVGAIGAVVALGGAFALRRLR